MRIWPISVIFLTRYLHPHILDYSRRLTETFPGDLSVVFWVNSGSEANDLALRLARAHTRKRGVLCVDGAYHGHVTSIIDISPYKFDREGGAGMRRSVRKAAIPDAFSGIYRGALSDDAVGAAYAAEALSHLDHFAGLEAEEASALAGARAALGGNASPADLAAAARVEADGLSAGCGAFICESILSCGGQIVPPAGYFKRVYAGVRAAGGVCIADEVQVGFGRVGSHFWAFELQGVVPDIVTLGKPMGNGFPVAGESEEHGASLVTLFTLPPPPPTHSCRNYSCDRGFLCEWNGVLQYFCGKREEGSWLLQHSFAFTTLPLPCICSPSLAL